MYFAHSQKSLLFDADRTGGIAYLFSMMRYSKCSSMPIKKYEITVLTVLNYVNRIAVYDFRGPAANVVNLPCPKRYSHITFQKGPIPFCFRQRLFEIFLQDTSDIY